MTQKAHIVSDTDITRIIKRDFPSSAFDEVIDILKIYQSESKAGMNRVYAAALKLSNCDVYLLKKYIDKANYDYRDVIALAEYPNYSEHVFASDMTERKKEQLISDDWNQYQSWLNRI